MSEAAKLFARCMLRVLLLVLGAAGVHAVSANSPLYSNTTGDVKRNDGTTWKVTVTEIDRQPRFSLIRIAHEGHLPSVGSSMFIACSITNLARERGFRYVAQLGDAGTLKIGFLDRLEDDPVAMIGAEFTGLPPARKYDVEQFAPVCDVRKRGDAPPGKVQ